MAKKVSIKTVTVEQLQKLKTAQLKDLCKQAKIDDYDDLEDDDLITVLESVLEDEDDLGEEEESLEEEEESLEDDDESLEDDDESLEDEDDLGEEEESLEEDDDLEEEPEPPKKKRGRSAKAKSDEPEKPKGKRGRPAKAKEEAPAEKPAKKGKKAADPLAASRAVTKNLNQQLKDKGLWKKGCQFLSVKEKEALLKAGKPAAAGAKKVYKILADKLEAIAAKNSERATAKAAEAEEPETQEEPAAKPSGVRAKLEAMKRPKLEKWAAKYGASKKAISNATDEKLIAFVEKKYNAEKAE